MAERPAGLGRWFDIAVAVSVLLLGCPLWVAVAVAIRVTSGGPLLHRATRVGKSGKPFELLKFRTMHLAEGAPITSDSDPRVTGVGRVLRLTKLDEIPQLVNVLRGQMAILGPRPEDPRYVSLEDPVHQFVLSVLPGLTSRASVVYRHEARILALSDDIERSYREEILPEKLMLDAKWLAERTVWTDLWIVWRTAIGIVSRHS